MRKMLTLFTLFIFLLFASCQKNISDTISTPASARVKTYTEDIRSASIGNSVITYNLSYDASGRLTSLVSASSPGNKFVYQYNSNNTFTMDLYNSNALSVHEVFFLNNIPYVDSTFQYDDAGDSTTEKYIYNSSKQLIQQKEYAYSKVNGTNLLNTHTYVYDAKGNVIKDTDDFAAITYEYGDVVNSVTLGLMYFTQNKNMPVKETYTSGGATVTVNYTYTFDSSKRLSTEKAVASNGDIIIKTYTY